MMFEVVLLIGNPFATPFPRLQKTRIEAESEQQIRQWFKEAKRDGLPTVAHCSLSEIKEVRGGSHE